VAEHPPLRKGSKGDAAKGFQNALRYRGYDPGAVDGAFGGGTERTEDMGGSVRSRGAVRRHTEGDRPARLGDAERWSGLYEANDDRIADPDKIRPGQILVLPGAC
jgi:nucleoid-associated protein YgaU